MFLQQMSKELGQIVLFLVKGLLPIKITEQKGTYNVTFRVNYEF